MKVDLDRIPMPRVPRSRLFMSMGESLALIAEHVKWPGYAVDLHDDDPERTQVEFLGLFTTPNPSRPEVMVRITRAVKEPHVVVLAATVGRDRRTPVVREVERIEWARWCGHPDGVRGVLHGENAAQYHRWREEDFVEVI